MDIVTELIIELAIKSLRLVRSLIGVPRLEALAEKAILARPRKTVSGIPDQLMELIIITTYVSLITAGVFRESGFYSFLQGVLIVRWLVALSIDRVITAPVETEGRPGGVSYTESTSLSAYAGPGITCPGLAHAGACVMEIVVDITGIRVICPNGDTLPRVLEITSRIR